MTQIQNAIITMLNTKYKTQVWVITYDIETIIKCVNKIMAYKKYTYMIVQWIQKLFIYFMYIM